jgi:hypothetical protein
MARALSWPTEASLSAFYYCSLSPFDDAEQICSESRMRDMRGGCGGDYMSIVPAIILDTFFHQKKIQSEKIAENCPNPNPNPNLGRQFKPSEGLERVW